MNTDSHPQEALLLAYVDNQLDAEHIAEVEALIASDASAAELVEQFRSSALPYAEAFDQHLAEAPRELISQIEDKTANSSDQPAAETRVQPSIRRMRSMAAVLIVGIFLGIVCSTILNKTSQNAQTPTWLAQVASYHELYVRETVSGSAQVATPALAEKLSEVLGDEMTIPDLREHQLEFRRGQVLQVEGAPLVQLAYLPSSGMPVALCITRNNAGDKALHSGVSHNLNYASWAKDGLSYVIVGHIDAATLEDAARSAMQQLL
ncbi:MAG: hypothetical protein AAF434_06620 [Pseudomonadota bacterium]